jgi:O-antigen/teichoic acid export membrane protein
MSLWRRYKKSELITQTDRSNAILFSRNNILAFSWPFIFTSSLWWMQTQSYRFILGIYHGIENVGLFVTAYALAASPIMICEGIIAQYLEPTFYNNLKYQDREGQVRAWNNYARLFIPGMVVIGIYVAASVPFLAKLFLGGEYRTIAIKVSGWAAIIETTRSAGTMMFQLGMAKLDNRMTIWPAAVGAITAPSAVFFMTQFDSIYGTIGGLLFSGLLVLVTNILISYKVLPVTWPYKRILFSGLLSLPVFIALRLLFNLFPNPGYLESFFALAVSGIYVAVIVFYLLSSRFLNK